MTSPWAALTILLAVVVFGIGALYAVSLLAAAERAPLVVAPFQSGQWPVEHAVSRFHARWYAMAILFLAFDVEMIFMYPWTLIVAERGTTAVVEMFSFLAVLLVGVGYARREGALRWS